MKYKIAGVIEKDDAGYFLRKYQWKNLVVSILVMASLFAGCAPKVRLIDVAAKNDVATLTQMLNKTNSQKDLNEALVAAVMKKSHDAMVLLFEAGADPNAVQGNTPLNIATSAPFSPDLQTVQALLNHGADPNLPDSTGQRPIHMILYEYERHKKLDIVSALLAAGADPKAKDHRGKSAIQIAEEKELNEVLELFDSFSNGNLGASKKGS